VALHPKGAVAPSAIPVERWTARDRHEAMSLALWALRGVGDTARRHVEVGRVAIHVRRPMTGDEAAGLPPRAH
jgi:hypothetical protein